MRLPRGRRLLPIALVLSLLWLLLPAARRARRQPVVPDAVVDELAVVLAGEG